MLYASVEKKYKTLLFAGDNLLLLFSILLCSGLIYFVEIFSIDLIRIIFQRGVFSQYDVIESASYMRELSKGFLFIFIASVLFQPFFTWRSHIYHLSGASDMLL